jgi:hypothetical protein
MCIKQGIKTFFIQERYLNKSYAQQPCPFITGIPEGGFYISFGPNDPYCRIHSDNESLSWDLLSVYHDQFHGFLDILAKEK